MQLLLLAALTAPAARADEPSKAEARASFTQAVTLFDERRFADALAAFQKSYSLYPVYSTLYNIGQVHVALGHPVEAVDAYEKFLMQGGGSIPADQRSRVEAEVAAQRQRIGELALSVSPDGAEVRVDGDVVAHSPVARPVRVSAGHHRVEVMMDGYRSGRKEVDVQGNGSIAWTVTLQPLATPTASTPPSPVAAKSGAPAPMPAPGPAPVPATRDEGQSSSRGSGQRVVGYALGGAGLVAAGVGTWLTIAGKGKQDDAVAAMNKANASVPHDVTGYDQGSADYDSAHSKMTTGEIVLGAGGALLVTGIVVVLTAPSGSDAEPRSAAVRWSPWVSGNAGGAAVGGVW